jgi:hypothetical protein
MILEKAELLEKCKGKEVVSVGNNGINFVKKKAKVFSGKSKQKADFKKEVRKCFVCQAEGHLAANCPNNGSREKGKHYADFFRKEEKVLEERKKVQFQKNGSAVVYAVKSQSELCCISCEVKGLSGVALVDSGS